MRSGARRSGVRSLAVIVALLGLLALTSTAAAAPATDSWVQRALALQYDLAGDVPLRNTPWVSTHNSFNSIAEMGPAVAVLDANQDISISDQLNAGVRHLEIDTHPLLSPVPALGDVEPVVCHTVCTLEKPLTAVLDEIRTWLRAHSDQVILVYLESHLENATGYGAGARAIASTLGDLVRRPAGGGRRCVPMPTGVTRDQIRATGDQVVLIGPCGSGTAWPSYVYDEAPRLTASDNAALREAPDCGPEFTRAQYDASPIRYYEDGTALGRLTASSHTAITPPLVRRMNRCGVDIVAFDHLLFADPRLAADVWSWAPGEPRPGGGECAIQRADGRWEARPCGERHRVACREADGGWTVSSFAVPAVAAPRQCRDRGSVNGVPRTGYQGRRLHEATDRAARHAGQDDVWLGLRHHGERWMRDERGDCAATLADPARRGRLRGHVARVVVSLRYACTGEALHATVTVSGGGRAAHGRTGHTIRVRVRPGTRRLRVRFTDRGRRQAADVLLTRR